PRAPAAGIAMLVHSGSGTAALSTAADDLASGSSTYTVNLSPAGEVAFNQVPGRVVTMDANYNDILVALRQEGKITATGYRDNFHDDYYRKLDGLEVRFDPKQTTYLSSPGGGMFDKELLYSLQADVHHIDPLQLALSRGWTQADVDEIARNVGPFIANRYSRENSHPGDTPYTYYTLWELSGKIAEVYRRPEIIGRLKEVGDRMVGEIQSKLPPESARPRVGLIYHANGKFTPYSLLHEGFGQVQYREVGARDAFAPIADRTYGAQGGGPSGAPLDAEGLLALDPDILIMPFAVYPGNARVGFEQLLALNNDPLLQRVGAFREGRVYPGGTPLQGPIDYLFQIEMAAKQIYPGIFGSFREDLDYPPGEQLFDRGQVSRILQEASCQDDGRQ
ncbi:ABC transporter substrate-binding protein, partial [Luteolibacter marinus]|uniref:ABC transporter substrate-binding protein n=1 Tax=Luteolibacter marinus TaxID=2776705 RepID=UPI001D006B2D